MKDLIIYIAFLILSSQFVFAQQVIVFKKENSSRERIFELPAKVSCDFRNGSSKDFILEAVRGDSLIFKKYYSQPNLDCVWNDVVEMVIHRDVDYINKPLALGCIIITSLGGMGIAFAVPEIVKDNPRGALFLGISGGIVFIASSTITYFITRNAFETFSPYNWKIYVK